MLERVAAHLGIMADSASRQVDVHVVDPYPPGGGRIWRRDQPADLLMNTVSAHATLFPDASVACSAPTDTGPAQYDWAGATAHADPRIAAEAADMTPWSHPTRAFHGHYLRWAFERARDRLPGGVRLTVHATRAVAIDDTADGRQTVRLEDGGRLTADAVVLALGHVGRRSRSALREAGPGLTVIGPDNPLDLDLSGVRPGEPVLVRGLGMNFFDVMSLLTIGRGGTFTRAPGGTLHYQASGREPVLCAGSRRGVPYAARGSYGEMPPRFPPRFFHPDELTGPLSFRRDVWPLVAKEAAYVYYATLLGDDGFLARFAELAWDSPAMRDLVAEAVPDPADRLDFAALDRPLAGLSFGDRDAFGAYVDGLLRTDVAHAYDARNSALKRAMTALGGTRERVRTLIMRGAITGGSYRDDLDGWFRGFASSLASGPPVRRIEELRALYAAGLLEFAGPDMTVTVDDGRFAATSPQIGGAPRHARTLIEAYLPEPDVRDSTDPLLRTMIAAGQARPRTLPDPDGPGVEIGLLDVTPGLRLVTADGTPHPRRFALGVPVHYGTSIGPMPGTNAEFLRQTDAVARAALDL